MIIVRLNPLYAVSMPTYDFQLGDVQNNELNLLTLNSANRYKFLPQDYQFATVSQYSVAIALFGGESVFSYSALPEWLSFDSDIGVLTAAPTADTTLGLYNIFVAASTAIPNNIFVGQVPNITTPMNSLDLLATLVELGYVSSESFLTSSFDPDQTLLLNSQYNASESIIRGILAQYYIEMAMQVTVSPSLIFTLGDHISINTKSQNPINLAITLEPDKDGNVPQFASKAYTALTTISEDKSTISMQGSLLEINTALAQIIVNSHNTTLCTGVVTASDGLNPSLNQSIPNICAYFISSQPPVANARLPIQKQVNQVSVSTGEQFIVQVSQNSFADPNDLDLTYSLSPINNTQVPDWLILKELSLTGTPPMQLSPAKISFNLVASNEFQSLAVPVSIDIKLSALYILKLIATYGGALITLLGLWVYAYRIRNILWKKHYRHPKDLIVEIGEKITEQLVYPISFIFEESKASDAVFKEMQKDINSYQNSKKDQLIEYLINDSTGQLDLDKLNSVIDDPLTSYLENNETEFGSGTPEVSLRKEKIIQLIVNKIVYKQLNSPKEKLTKDVFNRIRHHWLDLIEMTEGSSQFTINQENLLNELQHFDIDINCEDMDKLIKNKSRIDKNDTSNQSILDKSDEQDLNTSSVTRHKNTLTSLRDNTKDGSPSSVNIGLLENAIIAYAFSYFNLNINKAEVNIEVLQKIHGTSCWTKIKEFLKMDLIPVGFAVKGKSGYGIKCKVQQNVLQFTGTPDYTMRNKTLVVQIKSRRGKILREFWFRGVGRKPEYKPVVSQVL